MGMRERKYRVGRLIRDVRVMSTGHMWLEVRVAGRARPLVDFDPVCQEFHRWVGAPQYLIDEVMAVARALYAAGELKFYECNQEEQRRYENLRYFDADEAARLFGPEEVGK
jgi:hypothetical protein